MSLDQKIQVWTAVGTWLAGIATFLAVLVSLYLARTAQNVRIKATAGIRLVFAGDGSATEEHVGITVVNLGERTVIVNSIGWRVGRRDRRRFCIQPVSGQHTHQYPKQLAHGEQASFLLSFEVMPFWLKEFSNGFVEDVTASNLETLRALLHMSVGQSIEVVPEKNVLEKLRAAAG